MADPLTEAQRSALLALAEHGPLFGSQVGAHLWDVRRASDNGCRSMRAHKLLYALEHKGLVKHGQAGWRLTDAGREANRG